MKKHLILTTVIILLLGCTNSESAQQRIEEGAEIAAEIEATSIEETEEVIATMAPEETAVPTPTSPPPPTPTTPPTEVPLDEQLNIEVLDEPEVVQPNIEVVTFTASDGLQIQATYATPGGEAPFPAVMLLHMLGSNRQVWEATAMVDSLRLAGYAVLYVDMRGHGDTGGDDDWTLAREDLNMVYEQFIQFEAVDAAQTTVIGGSIGSNMALLTAVDQPDIDTAVLLSPGLNYLGVTTETEVINYGERPLLIIASEEDSYSADSSRTLNELATNSTLDIRTSAGHGTTMLTRQPELIDDIIAWLNEKLQ